MSAQPDDSSYPGHRGKDVPPRLLLQSAIRDAVRLARDDQAAQEERRARSAELVARRNEIIARRRQRVEDIRAGKFVPKTVIETHPAFAALRAERIAVAKREEAAAQLETQGRTMRTRSSDAKRKKEQEEGDSALAEVMDQLDKEDEESEQSGSDSDYDDDGAGATATADDAGGAHEDADMDDGSASDDGDVGEQADDSDTDELHVDRGADDTSSGDEDAASGASQKRHRTGNRKKVTKVVRPSPKNEHSGESDGGDGAFLEGFLRRWSSWTAFYEAFEVFQASTFQQFSGRTSTSVESRNRQMLNAVKQEAKKTGETVANVEARKGKQYIPEDWVKYCITLRCTHGRSQPARGSGKRKHRKVRSTKCSAKINARVVLGYSGWYVALNASGEHNHPVTKHQWFNYAENRKITDPGLAQDAINMHKAGAHAKGILAYLREQSGKLVTLRDVHNMVQSFKNELNAGTTDADRALAILDEFSAECEGNVAEIMVNSETNVARVVTFQSARMKRLFRAFPEVVLVDATHDTNANRYKLFSFAVHDVFGKGQYVFHSLVESEEKPNLRMVINRFKKHNPAWKNIRVLMTDKAMHEKAVLREAIPQARQLLCQWHVITWLKKQAARLASKNKTQVKGLLKALVYSRSAQEYEDTKAALLDALGGDTDHDMYKFFLSNWDDNQDEWVSYRRVNVAHLDNNTNNRLESKWGKIKQVVESHFTLDETISTLITLQRIAEDEYVAQYHEVGSRPDLNEDPELAALGMQVSAYAFDLVAEQHAYAVGPNADYEVDVGVPGKATLTRPGTGSIHVVDTATSSCDCIFMQTCLLPCRHLMHFRFKNNYETVIPPLRTFSNRWIVHAPQNNIDEGDVGPGCFNKISCAPTRTEAPVAAADMYIQSKALAEKIVDRMALQSTPTFRVALNWMQEFYDSLQRGEVPEFVLRAQEVQSSSSRSTGLTQVSFVQPSSSTVNSSAGKPDEKELEDKQLIPSQGTSERELEDTRPIPAQGSSAGECRDQKYNAIGTGPSPEVEAGGTGSAPTISSTGTGSKPENTGGAPNSLACGTKESPISFAPAPRVRGLSKREKRRLAGGKELQEARALAVKIRDGKKTRKTRLDDVAALLEGAYSMDVAKAMVDALDLDCVEVQGALSVRPYNVGQRVPQLRAMPQLDKIKEAIDAINAKDNLKLLAHWPDYGSATFDQLEAMASVLEARNQFQLVQFTLDWIEGVEWQVKDVVPPFADTCDYTKQTYKGAVSGMRLGQVRLGPEWCHRSALTDFRENLWLHSSSVISGMLALKQMYPNVGVVNPSYHDLAGLERKKKTAGGFGAIDPSNERIIAVICLDHHWAAYLLDKRAKLCYLFDPLQLKGNVSIVKSSVQCIIEPMLGLKDEITYKEIDWCLQKDSSSCKVWCLVILELLLAGRPWADSLYKVLPYLRLRYLYKAIGVQQCEVIHDEE